jgi:maleylacetate reductase
MDSFTYSLHSQEIIFGAASLARLREVVTRYGWEKLVLYTSQSMRARGRVQEIHNLVGARLAAVRDDIQPHVQDKQVLPSVMIAKEVGADAIIALGGGSVLGMAKAIVSTLRKERGSDLPVPIIAIPTTYAGSEMTPVYGVTHTNETPPRKVTVNDPSIVPRVVMYDPELTLDLSPELTASTGINAFAHCIEALYSKTRNPLSSAAALDGIRHIYGALLDCVQDGDNLSARTEMLLGSHLAGLSLASVSMGIHHGLCHVLGGTANIPHGVTNAIILPHAIRFNTDATATELLPAARAMGISENGINPTGVIEAMADAISDWIRRMDLPQRLRDAGVNQSDLPNLAEIAFQSRTVQNNPKPVKDVAQIEALLRQAW